MKKFIFGMFAVVALMFVADTAQATHVVRQNLVVSQIQLVAPVVPVQQIVVSPVQNIVTQQVVTGCGYTQNIVQPIQVQKYIAPVVQQIQTVQPVVLQQVYQPQILSVVQPIVVQHQYQAVVQHVSQVQNIVVQKQVVQRQLIVNRGLRGFSSSLNISVNR